MVIMNEFQAVVLAAGRGTRLPEIIGNTPKCLLPVGPYPLLFYSLNLLQTHNFQEVIVIVLEDEKTEIQFALENTPLKLKLDFVTIPTDNEFGTADSLRYIHDKIKTDYLVLSCDIVTNISLYPLINKFRQHEASLAVLLLQSGFENDVTLPGPKAKQKSERDLIGINPQTQRLLFLASTSDFDEDVDMDAHLLRRYNELTIYSKLIDSHIYIFKKWTVKFLLNKKNLSTIKGEFLPYIIKKQKHKQSDAPIIDTQSEIGVNTRAENVITNYFPNMSISQRIVKASLFNDTNSMEPYNGDYLRCYAIEAPKDSIGIRINTTRNFFAINHKLSSIWSQLCGGLELSLISPNAIVNSTQTREIAAADNAKLSEKTSLSASVFGSKCFIHPKNIINKSIIMSGAVIEEGCNIENSIIGSKAIVRKGSVLKNSLIGPNFIVEEGSKKDNVHLSDADGFMEIDIE